MSVSNREALASVAEKLCDLVDELVFVGGRVAQLLVTDPAATRVRPTEDSDAVCETSSYTAFHDLENRLLVLGFARDKRQHAPICRWRHGDDVIDIMPDEESVLGFKNAWYGHVLKHNIRFEVVKGTTIRIVEAPVFLATKWDAFGQRGDEDWYGSHDLEDIVAVVAGRPELVSEIRERGGDVLLYLADRSRFFLESGSAEMVIAGALPDASNVPGLVGGVLQRFHQISELMAPG